MLRGTFVYYIFSLALNYDKCAQITGVMKINMCCRFGHKL